MNALRAKIEQAVQDLFPGHEWRTVIFDADHSVGVTIKFGDRGFGRRIRNAEEIIDKFVKIEADALVAAL